MTNEDLINIGVIVLLAAGLWIWVSMSQADPFVNPLTLQPDRVALTVQDQVQQGRSLAPQFEAELGGRSGGNIQARVEAIGQNLLNELNQLEQYWQGMLNQTPRWTVHPFRFSVLNDEMVNAFALPDGSIYITQGLLNYLNTDDQIAGVLGHEIGHVVLRHTANALENQFKGNLVLWVIESTLGQGLSTDVASVVNGLIQLGFNREQETQSDEFGYVLTCNAGYDPFALGDVFEVFQQLDDSFTPEWFRTHPLPENREEHLNELSCRFPVAALAS